MLQNKILTQNVKKLILDFPKLSKVLAMKEFTQNWIEIHKNLHCVHWPKKQIRKRIKSRQIRVL